MSEALGEAEALLSAEHKSNVQEDILFILYAFSPHHVLDFKMLAKVTTSIGLWVWYGIIVM